MKKTFLLLTVWAFLSRCSTDSLADGTKLYRIMTAGKVSHEYEYNAKGMVTKQTIYGIPDKKMSEIIYRYDSDDKLIKTESFTDVSSSSVNQQLVYGNTDIRYGTDGRLSEEISYLKIGAIYEFASKTMPTYDAGGRIISRVQLSIDNKPFNLYKYEYNNHGNIITLEAYQYDGATPKLGFRSTYEHDDKKNPYFNLSVMPFSVNKNNIVKTTVTNYNVTPGFPPNNYQSNHL